MSPLLLETQGSVARITLNRPEVHNAFNEPLIAELTDAFQRMGEDSSVHVVVLTGAGKSFCAGADLEWMGKMAGYSHEENLTDARALQILFQTIDACPKVTIARINGAALGGGAGLVAVCDLAVASEAAVFAFSEARLGLIPAVISPYVLRKIGWSHASWLFLTAQRFSAAQARQVGLVTFVAPAEGSALDGNIDQLLDNLAQCGPEALAATKRLLREIYGKSPGEAAEATVHAIAAARVSEEGKEGIQAFLAKRKPAWT